MSPRRPRRPALAFETLRSALRVRAATKAELGAAAACLVGLSLFILSGVRFAALVGVVVTTIGAVIGGAILVHKTIRGDAPSARGAFVLTLGFALALLIGRGGLALMAATTRTRGDQIAVALRAHLVREGTYPESLHQLVPRDLPAVPKTAVGLFRPHRFGYWPATNDYRLFFHAAMSRCERSARVPWRWWD